MPIPLSHMRDLLMPGLYAVTGSYYGIPEQWNFDPPFEYSRLPPELVMSAKEIAILGVAAIMTKNPVVSRRFWSAWE